MLRRTPLFRAVDAAQLSSGLQPDVHPLLSVLWEAASNVVFASGKVRRRRGNVQVLDTGVALPVRGLTQQQISNGTRYVWVAAGDVVKRWYGPPAETIYDFATWRQDDTLLASATYIDMLHYGDWTILNNGVDTPQLFKHGIGTAAFGNALPAAKFMKKLAFVVALGVGGTGRRIEWSDSQDITQWTATTTNNAGGLSVEEFDTRIKTGCPLGTQIAVYAEDQMALLTFTNAPYYFGVKVALDGIGAVGKMAVCGDGRNNFGVGRGGCWQTDGVSFRYIDEGFLSNYLQDNVNWGQQSKITAMRNDYTGCVEFGFPIGAATEVSEIWSFDPRNGGWSPLPGAQLKDERRVFQFPLVGDGAGKVYYDAADEDADTPLTLRTKPLLLQLQQGSRVEDIHVASRVDEFELLTKAATGVQVRIGCSHEINGVWDWSVWQDVSPDSKTYKVGPEIPDGVYWKLDFQNTQDDWALDLQGFLLFGNIEGSKRGTA